ncbi:uncharacterized protein K444DRAFT_612665 [Hyaloscypha bicolor E]|uniref:Protein kinase domain-containing protein n=1 Tax=Hyaloscypha bicolor E TaxID=1095630 RepID=A0A2J6TBX4_9HELO|nr:uncharacterized protein K444DRAFT_612665 [Hyaloscypha bicolor E]PMD60527.1 hypothetical protein K444DRAFT_612665 [Hyaloscypha bicolor E]
MSSGLYAMDIGTAIATGTLVYQFISACAEFSSKAGALAMGISMDMRGLQNVQEYFDNRRQQQQNHILSNDDEQLLQEISRHLKGLMDKAPRSLKALRSTGVSRAALALTWFIRRSEFLQLHNDLRDMLDRLDVKVIRLPPEVRTAIRLDIPPEGPGRVPAPAIIRSNEGLRRFVQLEPDDKKKLGLGMRLKDASQLDLLLADSPDLRSFPVSFKDRQLIFAARSVSENVASETSAFNKLETDVGILAAALNYLDPAADIRLLKVEFYHYHAESRQFLFAHYAPYRTDLVTTLKERIRTDPFPEVQVPLNQRLKLAYKLAEAVFFLHAADYVHKNITPSSVVSFRKWEEEEPDEPSTDLEDAYLMGYDLIRAIEARTRKEGAIKRDGDERSIWEFDLYQHPKRQLGKDSKKYAKEFDVYSLGVVLLEIGMWQPLESVALRLDQGDPKSWAGYLVDIATEQLKPVVGERYCKLVSWCLKLDSNDGMKETDFVANLLDPLEDMVNALS